MGMQDTIDELNQQLEYAEELVTSLREELAARPDLETVLALQEELATYRNTPPSVAPAVETVPLHILNQMSKRGVK